MYIKILNVYQVGPKKTRLFCYVFQGKGIIFNMRLSPLEQRIEEIIEPAIADLGFRLVTVKMDGDGARQILTVMAEDPETEKLGVDDCAKISRSISTLLDVEDPIKGAYRLEVSSPGIDRPLVRPEDFTRFENMLIKLETLTPVENQRRFKGILKGFNKDNQTIAIQTDQDTAEIDFANLKKASLVITDALLNMGRKTK